MIHGDIGPNAANLLLAGSPDLLEVVIVLFDCRSVGEGFENRYHGRRRIGAEEGEPAMIFLDQDHANHAA